MIHDNIRFSCVILLRNSAVYLCYPVLSASRPCLSVVVRTVNRKLIPLLICDTNGNILAKVLIIILTATQ